MKKINGMEKYIDTIKYLERLYDYCNEKLFGNELDKPVITVQLDSKNRANGWFTTEKVWKWQEKVPANCAMCEVDDCPRDGSVYQDCQEIIDCEAYEINITAQQLNRPIAQVAATLIHEMCHYYAAIHNLQDTSRSGSYHNKLFKGIAEKHGLMVSCVPTIGWSQTDLSVETDRLIQAFATEIPDSLIYRTFTFKGQVVRSSSTRKYECPCCHNSVRATKEVNIQCADCNELMRLVM